MNLAQDRQPCTLRREMQRVTQEDIDPTLVPTCVGQLHFEGLAQAQETSSDRIESRFEPIEVFKDGKLCEGKVADQIGTLRIVREETLALGLVEDLLHEFAQSWSITVRVESDSCAFPAPVVDAPLVGQEAVSRTFVLPFGVQSDNKEIVDGSGRNPLPILRLVNGRHLGAIFLALRVANNQDSGGPAPLSRRPGRDEGPSGRANCGRTNGGEDFPPPRSGRSRAPPRFPARVRGGPVAVDLPLCLRALANFATQEREEQNRSPATTPSERFSRSSGFVSPGREPKTSRPSYPPSIAALSAAWGGSVPPDYSTNRSFSCSLFLPSQ